MVLVKSRMPWWCGESGQQWRFLPDFVAFFDLLRVKIEFKLAM